jgi:outer membrane protein OmpA-like peptidoglycan-associated protein
MLAVIGARADWGHGLGGEFKSPYVPQNQQSGWGLKSESEDNTQTAYAVPEKTWRLEGVQFETGSDRLTPDSYPHLNKAAGILNSHKHVVVEIQGRTDNVGTPAENQSLSERRAAAVKQYLIGKGVESERMEARGYGESSPLASNQTDAGRAENRSIEFKVLSK